MLEVVSYLSSVAFIQRPFTYTSLSLKWVVSIVNNVVNILILTKNVINFPSFHLIQGPRVPEPVNWDKEHSLINVSFNAQCCVTFARTGQFCVMTLSITIGLDLLSSWVRCILQHRAAASSDKLQFCPSRTCWQLYILVVGFVQNCLNYYFKQKHILFFV